MIAEYQVTLIIEGEPPSEAEVLRACEEFLPDPTDDCCIVAVTVTGRSAE